MLIYVEFKTSSTWRNLMRVPVAASSGEPEPESVHLRWRYQAGLEKAGFKGRPWICTKRYVSVAKIWIWLRYVMY